MSRGRKRSIEGQFIAHRREMLESPAWRALSLSEHRVLSRIELEYMSHGGVENGKLPVTFDDFEAYGISEKSVAPALRGVQALGFARVTERGRASKSDFGRNPSKYELTYLIGGKPHFRAPTDDWRLHKTLEDAISAARIARAAKDERAVARALRKTVPRGEKFRASGVENHPTESSRSGIGNHPTSAGVENNPTFYISGEGEAA